MEVPDVMAVQWLDLLKFEVRLLGPRGSFSSCGLSPIPPHYSHIYTCEILGRKSAAAKRKRSGENDVTKLLVRKLQDEFIKTN